MNKILSKNECVDILNSIGVLDKVDVDFLYDIYKVAAEGIQNITIANKIIEIEGVNQITLLEYCIGEYLYIFSSANEKEAEIIKKNQIENNSISSIAADKYLSLGAFAFKEQKLNNRFSPEISSIDMYLNFLLNTLKLFKKNSPKNSLISDLLNKSISIARCILRLLINGYETEAFSLWRTLHECECTLIVLVNNGQNTINAYLKHMNYGIAFNSNVRSNEIDKIFEEIKSQMKEHDLKSKDMKKFIEYGWLYSSKNVDPQTLKLNFKDGLEVVAGLQAYKDLYTRSSELIHSTPLLIYSNKQYFNFVSMLCLYESFFRIEKIFNSLLKHSVDENSYTSYENMRKVYYPQLIVVHKNLASIFLEWQKNQTSA